MKLKETLVKTIMENRYKILSTLFLISMIYLSSYTFSNPGWEWYNIGNAIIIFMALISSILWFIGSFIGEMP